jgi:DNA-binding transcriptional ArsR family regulator
MNAFYEHHKNNIRFHYRCFDRLLLNGTIQPFQEEKRVVGFFWTYRKLYPVSRDVLRDIATQFHNWVLNRSQKWTVPIIKDSDDPEARRDKMLDSYFKGAKDDQVVCILKAREPARILTAKGNKKDNRWHLEYKQRWVDQYNFYLNDAQWGRMFIRVCPYFPFPARICLNQHYWLAQQMGRKDIRYRQSTNAFSQCSDPDALQQLADSLTADDLQRCGLKWLQQLIPFFTPRERRWAGIDHRLFFSQVELCDNLIFFRRAALDRMGERLLDANRTIGQPNKLTIIFGRKITKLYKGKLQTVIEDMDLPSPVIRSHYGNGFAKQYVRDRANLRTEPATNNVYDYGVLKGIENLPKLRQKQSAIIDRYLDVQQDILVSFIDRGQLHKLSQPTILSNGKRVPGLKLDQPRLLSLMHALVRFSHIAAGDSFSTKEIHADTAEALDRTTDDYTIASLRYDLSKLRAKGFVERLDKSRRYRLSRDGYRICVVFLKLFEKLYAPLTSGILKPFKPDRLVADDKATRLDKLYRTVVRALDELVAEVGLKVA